MTEQEKTQISRMFDKLDRDLETEHPHYTLGYKSALFDAMEVINKLPIQIVIPSFTCCKNIINATEICKKQCDDCKMVYVG